MPESSIRPHSKAQTPAGEIATLGHRWLAVALVAAPTRLILFFVMGFIHVGADGSGRVAPVPRDVAGEYADGR